MFRTLTARLLVLTSLGAGALAAHASDTIRICDPAGCAERPRSTATFDHASDDNAEETRRLNPLVELARQQPRAAFDLGLRYFRGEGVRRDSYQALRWMREAGQRGHAQAWLALGRLYLAGLEEMGPDPAEAEKWLALAAAHGDKPAIQLLKDARAAKKDEQSFAQWRLAHRPAWYGWWSTGYVYHAVWTPAGWYLR